MIEANKGKLPKKSPDPITPPTPVTIEHPKLPEPAAIDVQKDIQLPDNQHADDRHAQLAQRDDGLGWQAATAQAWERARAAASAPAYGNGYGPGYGGNTGGGVYQIGGRVSAPVPIFQPEAEFSDEARRAKYQGVCIIALIVDAQGNPQNVHVIRTLGMGLDEKAMEAVRRYKFKPAMKDGKTPVPMMITVEVDFHLY